MRLLRSLPLVALVCFLLAPAARAGIEVKTFQPSSTGISALPLNTPQTMLLTITGYSQLIVYVNLTRSAATAINMVCAAGMTQAQAAPIPVANVNATTGAITLSASTFTQAVSASGWYRFNVMPLNDQVISCVFTGTAANSGDLVTVYARAGVP